VQVLEDEAVEKFEVSWKELLESTQSELTRLAKENSE
jgi:transaldolase